MIAKLFSNNNIANSKNDTANRFFEKKDNNTEANGSLFGKIDTKFFKDQKEVKDTSFFGKDKQKENGENDHKKEGDDKNVDVKKQGGLFDFAKTGSSLFSNGNEDKKQGGLFDGLLTKKPSDNTGGSFFGGSSDGIGKKTGLFDGLLNPSNNNSTGCGNLFGSSNTPIAGVFSKTGGDDDEEAIEGEEGDEDEVPGQDVASDPTKSTGTYKYENQSTDLLNV